MLLQNRPIARQNSLNRTTGPPRVPISAQLVIRPEPEAAKATGGNTHKVNVDHPDFDIVKLADLGISRKR